jgi:predicted acyltransferase
MAPPTRERLVSLDVLRGLTIAGMILVNNAGDWSYVFAPLQHAPWDGWTPTDLIFPSFLFIVGVSMAFAFARYLGPERPPGRVYLRVARRVVILFGLGLVLNALNCIPWCPWWHILTGVRIPGVLQRIAVVYGITALLVLRTTPRQQAYAAALCLLLYWALMTLVPVPGYGTGVLTAEGNLAAYVDNLLLRGHLWQGSWDPEGILSTMPAIASALFGVLAGQWLQTSRDPYEKVSGLFVMGGAGLLLGVAWDPFFPINKNLWTSSYVVFTTGMALAALAFCYWLVDIKRYRRLAIPFVVFGTNAITVYALSILLDWILAWWSLSQPDGSRVSLKTWIYVHGYAPWGQRFGPESASFLYALTYVLLWLGLMWLLYRKRIFINI